MKKLITFLMMLFCVVNAQAAYLRNIPMTVNQPDGTVLHCFASGDEYFNYLHDKDGFTIMRHPQTGYYVYAEKRGGELVATNYVAGVHDPASKGLEPYALISPEEWMARRKAWEVPDERPRNREANHGTLNNISIFIRFSDDEEFTNSYSSIDNMFNDVSTDAVSMRSYFRAASYNAIEIPTYFYPGHNGDVIISYCDTYPRSYFEPYDASTNPNGYQEDERTDREFSLLVRAVTYINNNYPVSSNLNLDYDNDGLVDNVCFIVRGGVGAWSSLLWPHKWALYDRTVKINGKRVYTFNFQLADASAYFNASVMCHEMNHSLGAPDLYHYNYGTSLSPVGPWDLMEDNAMPPQHCGAYMKMKYGLWIDEIPEITQAGTYTLNPISSATPNNVAYKIATEYSDQFYVLEYRDNTSLFETSLPGSGLLIYRINTSFGGNASYDPSSGIYDEVYLYRPGGSTSSNGDLWTAHFSSDVGRSEFSASTSAYPFFTDGTIDNNFRIYNITEAGNTISFSYGTSSNCEAPINLIASLDGFNVSLSWDAANNAQSYNVYRNGQLLGNTSATTYVDAIIDYGKYSYYVKSVDANGLLSTPSETAVVTIAPEGAVIVGEGNLSSDDYLPSYSYYNYSLTQQIYTADEIGQAGMINSIAFYNLGAEKTRTLDFYLKHIKKNTFSSSTDWETVSSTEKVFSGSVTMESEAWTKIVFDTPFSYDGTSNLLLVTDDNTGGWTYPPHMSCRTVNVPNQAIRVFSDDVNYNPSNPGSYNGTILSDKNQVLLFFAPGSGNFAFQQTCTLGMGWNWWSTFIEMNGVDGLGMLQTGLATVGMTISAQQGFTTYENGEWQEGSLSQINNESMYKINTVGAITFPMEGDIADPAEHQIALRNGWTYIGYVRNDNMYLNEALADFTAADDDIVKNLRDGFATYYEGYGWYPDNKIMKPGYGYMIKSSTATSFYYPNYKKDVTPVEAPADEVLYWTPVYDRFPSNMNVMAVVNLNGMELRSNEVEVGAFAENGECRGAAKLCYVEPINRYVAFLSVRGDNGEAIYLRMVSDGKVYDIEESLTMTIDEVIGSLKNPFALNAKGNTGVNETRWIVNLFPNPVDKGGRVRMELPSSMEPVGVRIEVYDALGQLVVTGTLNGDHPEMEGMRVSGLYTLKVIDRQGNVCYSKLVVK